MSSTRTRVETVLNTLQHERHARTALLMAFADELRAALPDRAPESTRALSALAKAEHAPLEEEEFASLLTDLRAIARDAA
jgi:hypothetical protein